MKTVNRRKPAKPRRRARLISPEAEPLPPKDRPKPGMPSSDGWVTLEEKNRRAARAAHLRPHHPAFDPKLDEPALAALRAVSAVLQATPERWPDASLAALLIEAAQSNDVTWRALRLIEDALERIFPENVTTKGRTMGVIWLNNHYAKMTGDIVYVLEAALER